MITLADMLTAGVTIDWPEAVALAREIVALADQDGNLSLVPTLDAVGVRADGTVHAIGPTVAEGDPVAAAAAALATLLGDQPCPPELRALASQAMEGATPGAPSSLAEFDQALSYFERPGRKQMLRALYERADVVESEQIAEAELARLTARARGAEPPPLPVVARVAPTPAPTQPPAAPPVARQRRSIPVPLVIGLAVVALVALVVAGLGLVGGASAGWASAWWPSWGGDAAAERPKLVPEGTGEKAAPRTGARRAAREGQAVTAPDSIAGDSVPLPARGGREPRADRVDIKLPTAGDTSGSSGQVVHIQTLPVPEGSNFIVPPASAARQAIYMADDPTVTPPQILRPHLPSEPAEWMTPGDIGTFDLLVRPDGSVEQVRLTSPSNRFQERMLLSAAKAWRFRPATRGGVPVWCHVRVKVTI